MHTLNSVVSVSDLTRRKKNQDILEVAIKSCGQSVIHMNTIGLSKLRDAANHANEVLMVKNMKLHSVSSSNTHQSLVDISMYARKFTIEVARDFSERCVVFEQNEVQQSEYAPVN